MKIENNMIVKLDEVDFENLFIPKNVVGIRFPTYDIGSSFSIKSIIVEEGNTAFYVQNNCLIERATKTLVVAAENGTIPDDGSVEIINSSAFDRRQNLPHVLIIPDGVKEIGSFAFAETNVEKVILPASLETIGYGVFRSILIYKPVLKEIVVDCANPHFYVQSNCLIHHDTNTVMHIIDWNVREVVIPQGVESIASAVFYYKYPFEKIYLPSSVKEITLNFNLGPRTLFCDGSEAFRKFCEENHIEYAYDKR